MSTHIYFLHGTSSHVRILEVDKGTESLVQNTDTLDLTVPEIQSKLLQPPWLNMEYSV